MDQIGRGEQAQVTADGSQSAAATPKRWRWVPLLVVAVVTAGVVMLAGYGALTLIGQLRGDTAGGGGQTGTQVGDTAPDVTVYDLNGKQVRLSDFRGKTVLLNFRATWCRYCQTEAPALQQASQSLKDLTILAVYVNEDAATVQGFADANGYTFPMYTDSGAAAQAYDVQGIPASFFIDAKGRIFATALGSLTNESLQSYLSQQ